MSTRMLRWSVVALMMVVAVGTAPAQEASAGTPSPEVRYAGQYDRLVKGMDINAHQDIPGVVESTIYNLVQCKSVFPDKDYTRYVRYLEQTAARQSDAVLIYKATLASMYLRYGSPIRDGAVFDPTDHEKAFKAVANQLAATLLATNTQ